MDLAGSRRGVADRGERQGMKLHAVIIGEPLLPMRMHGGHLVAVGPLSPLSPSPRLPAALLPVCNTSVIDYVLENLVVNGVEEATVLLNASSAVATIAHLSTCRTARGKPWTQSDSIRVNVVECARRIASLADAAQEMRERNVVEQQGSFLFVPIDSIASFANLRVCFQTHLERVRKVGKYAATLLCVSSRASLVAAQHNSLVNHLGEAEEAAAQQIISPTNLRHGLLSIQQTSDMLRLRSYAAPYAPKEHHTMFVVNKATQVVTYMARFENGEDAPEPPTVVFNGSAQQSVRMDLTPTGFLFCCSEALSLIEFHIRDLYSFLNLSLLGQAEIFGNVFGIIELPSTTAVVESMNGVEAYIQANLDVCARRLFPMTRESCFAEAVAKYAVASLCETVYLHTTAKCASSNVGPNVVVGEQVNVPATVELVGTVLGAGVELGEGAILRSSVIMDGVRIGAGCSLEGCLVGPHAIIRDGAELSYAVIGERCIIDGVTSGGASLVLSHVAIECDVAEAMKEDAEHESVARNGGASSAAPSSSAGAASSSSSDVDGGDARGTDVLLVGQNGRGHAVEERYSSSIIPTTALFTEDPVARAVQQDEEDDFSEEDDERGLFRRSIQRHVETALLHPGRIEASSYDMSTVCLTSGFGYPEMCEIVTELLMEHLLAERKDESGAVIVASPADLVDAAHELFQMWCRPFYNNFLSRNNQQNVEAMVATLEGLCGSIGSETCPLHSYGPQLVEMLYYGCDDTLYDERGYCIVSEEGLFAFDVQMEHRREVLQRYTTFKGKKHDSSSSSSSSTSSDSDDSGDSDDDESRDLYEEGKVLVAVSCHDFIEGVRAFIQGQDGG
ncbi:putative guanine-nucleotide-exchange-factor putativetranslation initiation factor EIF-2B subunit [Leptomonas pyrrhocoris]|uniref:Putative guanine-nucleotide-exchange-factor putativetranslation initiation factor EIF-2B subunit n=1 Tax=Leptomonas pyrrhocoris TaxID=157538 RepID=A0A0M9G904_LEPPY|nr:putative guanine-nucleotide-exchange-factor putativetranslation initiation factor EIF-2B subunit [Leptomonas pyrrhocoris]KPA85187.1 putative guanine-nucleotide-exchange-factor putativetranslation initiation factor EIF-2B subunit [Leptomonas pyrrhocoris]|eukprot:XP_015663626.1 putative guanine-nucleotide-exchange-factor putativetranslation initiation factor EIF-2B subunit [Leptomonas pyrrhocoris]